MFMLKLKERKRLYNLKSNHMERNIIIDDREFRFL